MNTLKYKSALCEDLVRLFLPGGTKLLRKSIDGPYRFERLFKKFLSKLDIDDTKNGDGRYQNNTI